MNTDSPRPIRSENRFRKPCFDWRSARPKRSRRAENRGRLTSLNEAWVPHSPRRLAGLRRGFPLTERLAPNGFLRGAESGSLAEQPRASRACESAGR